MRTIHRYILETEQVMQTIQMPEDSIILNAGLDTLNNLCIWAMIDTDTPIEDRQIFIFGTGWDVTTFIDEMGSLEYVNYVNVGEYTWHIFIDDKDFVTIELIDEDEDESFSENEM